MVPAQSHGYNRKRYFPCWDSKCALFWRIGRYYNSSNTVFLIFSGIITDNILLPLGGLTMCYYVGWKWHPEYLISEIERDGVPFKLKKALDYSDSLHYANFGWYCYFDRVLADLFSNI